MTYRELKTCKIGDTITFYSGRWKGHVAMITKIGTPNEYGHAQIDFDTSSGDHGTTTHDWAFRFKVCHET